MAEFWTNLRKISNNTLRSAENPLKIVISPLEWGLGHATRLVPLIHWLQTQGAEVWLASTGSPASILAQHFPDLPMLDLPGFALRYPKRGGHFFWSMASQMRGFMQSIKAEEVWLKAQYPMYRWDMVISDNRYGFHHPAAHNILITHQLFPRTGLRWFPDFLLHQKLIQLAGPFQQVWVPDAIGETNLSGALSHSAGSDLREGQSIAPNTKDGFGQKLRFIGPLSRFSETLPADEANGIEALPDFPKDGFVLVLLSGPEPQRTLLEEKVLATVDQVKLPVILVRGLPGQETLHSVQENLTSFSHLSTVQLNALIKQADAVICRAGYSTIMDLSCLNKNALLVPTPGQGEQEYLARYLAYKGHFPFVQQEDFTMPHALEVMFGFRGSPPSMDFLEFTRVLPGCLNALDGMDSTTLMPVKV